MQHTDAEELARARLAYVSAGRPALGAPRRALVEPASPLVEPGSPHTLVEPGSPREPVSKPPQLTTDVDPEHLSTLLPRPPLTVKHLMVVAVLVLCGVGVAVAALSRSAATEVPIAPVTVSQAPAPPSSPPPVVMLRVHVAGAVSEPGVVTLPEGTIVQDAILAAGGLAESADPAGLNLAAPVSDGMQILIGTVGDPLGEVVGAAPSSASGGDGGQGGLVNLNTAGQAELESLPGVGPVMAQSILAWREESGPFTAVEDLQEISGIGPKTFEKLQPLVTV
ncbi:helix-hairpin-helix domain-containing protein [Tessaracoccus massiliensis]|uniref:helix-hairpin-helix domain-containing protein n=1 Tax=Tessaracoccus massiliensis TaxID=1522311 RepID=UPI001C573010|nr:helix-hairpin-helix domain-containing protein [Tessaracoccus massiliensis]